MNGLKINEMIAQLKLWCVFEVGELCFEEKLDRKEV